MSFLIFKPALACPFDITIGPGCDACNLRLQPILIQAYTLGFDHIATQIEGFIDAASNITTFKRDFADEKIGHANASDGIGRDVGENTDTRAKAEENTARQAVDMSRGAWWTQLPAVEAATEEAEMPASEGRSDGDLERVERLVAHASQIMETLINRSSQHQML